LAKNYDDILSRFHLIPERYGRTDGQTDRQICYINIAHQHTGTALLTRDKNREDLPNLGLLGSLLKQMKE